MTINWKLLKKATLLRFLQILIIFLSWSNLEAQGVLLGSNLIKNPGFEFYDECPSNVHQLDRASHYHSIVGGATFYHSCSDSVNSHFNGLLEIIGNDHFPYNGNGMASAFIWTNLIYVHDIFKETKYRGKEYIHGELSEALKPGVYYFSVMAKSIEERFRTDNLGLFISDTLLNFIPDTNFYDVDPQFYYGQFLPHSKWTKVQGCLVAKGGESFFILGGFYGNDEVNVIDIMPESLKTQKSFLLFDDLELRKINENFILDTSVCLNTRLRARDLNSKINFDYFIFPNGRIDSILIAEKALNVIAVNENCNEISVRLTIDDCEVTQAQFLPNAFSPNNDLRNDILFPIFTHSKILSMNIYDRWGNQMYSSTDHWEWDGSFNGKPCGVGVYLVFIEYYDEFEGVNKVFTRDVLLIR